MKGSFKLRPRRVLSRGEAWACFTANLALPGSGSLAAGRVIGYWQMAACFISFGVSVVTAIPMLQWAMAGGVSDMQSTAVDPSHQLAELCQHAKWPVFGMVLFAGTILWATITSMAILNESPKERVPPRIV